MLQTETGVYKLCATNCHPSSYKLDFKQSWDDIRKETTQKVLESLNFKSMIDGKRKEKFPSHSYFFKNIP